MTQQEKDIKLNKIDKHLNLKEGTSKKILTLVLKRQNFILNFNNPIDFDYYHSSFDIDIEFTPKKLTIEDIVLDSFSLNQITELIENEIELFNLLKSI
jgi:hypothetical protein